MLIHAINQGPHPYPQAEDFEPPSACALLCHKMCSDVLAMLSERLYLAAQTQLMH